MNSLVKKANRIIYLLLMTILFTNLAFSQNPTSSADFFPIQLGNKWAFDKMDSNGNKIGEREWRIYGSYNNDDGELNYLVTQEEIESGDTTFSEGLLTTNNFSNGYDFYLNIDDFFSSFSGKHYLEEGDVFIGADEHQYTVSYYGSLVTPAEVFDSCFQIERDIFVEEKTINYIYAPGIGPIAILEDGVFIYLLNCYSTNDIYTPEEEEVIVNSGLNIAVDSLGGAYIYDQLIVQFEPSVSDAERTHLRDTLGVMHYDTCICNRDLELWQFNETYTDIINKKKKAEASSCVEEIGNNYIIHEKIKENPTLPLPSLLQIPDVPITTSSDLFIILVPDTGVDFDILSEAEKEYFYVRGPSIDDWDGWTFIGNNNNPFDDHKNKHGTRVIQTIIDNLVDMDVDASSVKILPLKTQDDQGIGLLFDATCSLYYGMKKGVSLINASWGHYGVESTVLKAAIDSLANRNTVLITGAGNDTFSIDVKPFYPAALPNDNIVVATSLEDDNTLSPFSNTSKNHVDIGCIAPDGTSFASPALAAAIAKNFDIWGYDTDYEKIIAGVLDCSTNDPSLNEAIAQGRILNLDIPCTPLERGCTIDIFPNPASTSTNIYIEQNLNFATDELVIYNQIGIVVRVINCADFIKDTIIEVDLDGLPSGVYYVSYVNEEEVLSACVLIKQ